MSRNDAIRKVLNSEPEGRRNQSRNQFCDRLSIATYDGSNHPAEEEFYEVEGKDLSASGIGFFTPNPPQGDIVLALGDPIAPIYLIGTVVHARRGYFQRKQQYFVGCRFTGRLLSYSDSESKTPVAT
ncbi:MAG: hypothetical protein ACI9HK_001036 [Pirellulaceae bacterium]|jgi:hypothetical protein